MQKIWPDLSLRREVEQFFNRKYGRKLEKGEVLEIANALVCYMESIMNYENRAQHANKS